MELQNIFNDKRIVNVIPVFTALYLAYNFKMILLPAFLILNVLIFYLAILSLAKEISNKEIQASNKMHLENIVFKELLSRDYVKVNALLSFTHWSTLIITAIILYLHRVDFIPFILFWYLVIGFAYNLISLFINHLNIIKKAFTGKL